MVERGRQTGSHGESTGSTEEVPRDAEGAAMGEPQRMAIEDLARRILDNLLEGCQVIGPDFRYLYVNEAVARHGRTTREQLLGRTMTEAYPGIEDTAIFAVLRRCMQERAPQQMENEFTFPDGSKSWFDLRFEPGSEGVTILSMDITARKRAEQALMRSNRALATLSVCNQALVRATDEQGFMNDVCRIAVERGGYRFAWIGLKEADTACSVRPVAYAGHDDGYLDSLHVTWDDTERGQGPTGCAIRTGRSAVARFIATDPEFAPWRRDALERGFASSIALPIRCDGECVGALMMYAVEPDAFDDDEQRLLDEMAMDLGYGLTTLRTRIARRQAEARADEALAESEARTRAIYDHLPNPTFVWQRRGNGFVLNAFNQAARITTEEGVASFLGRSAAELPHGFPDLIEDLERCFQQRVPIRRELEYCPPVASAPRQLVATYGFIPPDMVLLHTEDVTEQRRTEEHLRVAQRMEAIGKLAGGIAHDFNNLLSVILSYTAFALEGVREGDPMRDDLLEVKKAAKRAAALTSQLLAFSRKQVLQPVLLDLNQIAAGVEKMLRRILGEDIDFVQVLAPDLGLTLADPGQIEQVLMNLVVNARDAMLLGGRLTVESSNVEIDEEYTARHGAVNPGSYVRLLVTDTGCGMDEQTRARIFEPFFTTKEMGKGTGLGLSTVYGIVKQSGGNIWVHSELGKGTTFAVYLPRELSATTATTPRPPTVPPQRTGTETILVVEDEEALLKIAKRALDAAGYTVLTAADGDEALRTCAQHVGDIRLLVTDVVMPGMSGRTLAQELSKTRPTLGVLYMSGYTDNAIVHHGVLDAGTHFLAKPFTAASLALKVREVLDYGITDPADEREQAVKADAEMKEQPLDRDALRALSQDLLGKLRKAVIAAHYDEIVDLIETIRTTEPEVAAGLRRMADLFDYGDMLDLLRE
jgi:two-component system, cell cycle sensor histidine kinase and response regulator CckA